MSKQDIVKQIAEKTTQACKLIEEAAALAIEHNCPYSFILNGDDDGYPAGGKLEYEVDIPGTEQQWSCRPITYETMEYYIDDGVFNEARAIEEYGKENVQCYLENKDKRPRYWQRWKASAETAEC